MSLLYLVRHGQTAGFVEGSYTDLTEAGAAQSRALGSWFGQQGIRPDALFVGPHARHHHTVAELTTTAKGWPPPAVLRGLAEHDAREVFGQALSAWAGREDEMGVAARSVAAGTASNRGSMSFFREAMAAWIDGRLDVPTATTWPTFRTRTLEAMDQMVSTAGDGRTVVAVTSAGTIGAIVAALLKLPDEHGALALGYALFNTSVTEVRFSSRGRTLSRFNSTPHLGPTLPPTSV